MFRKTLYTLFITYLISTTPCHSSPPSKPESGCPIVKLELERLPDMNLARSGHILLSLGDEILAIGGHTDGFVPTSTAEYYKDGEWHLLNTVYTHDDGFAVTLKSGKVLVGGGHEQPLGIGQTYPVEYYYPQEHSFKGFGCLDTKRSLCRAIELDSGKVLIAGNHYNDDSFEMFDGEKLFHKAGEVSENRCSPYLLRCGKMDAVVFGKYDNKMQLTESDQLDRLSGGTYHIPLLKDWTPYYFDTPISTDVSFIGDVDKGDYRYLIAGAKKDGTLQVVCINDTMFTPVHTSSTIPTTFEGQEITYASVVIVDRQQERCYVKGSDKLHRIYLLCLSYKELNQPNGVPITLYYTDPQPYTVNSTPILLPNGDLLFAGGIIDSNFTPLKSVFVVNTGFQSPSDNASNSILFWISIIAGCCVIAGAVIWNLRRKTAQKAKLQTIHQDSATQQQPETKTEPQAEDSTTPSKAPTDDASDSPQSESNNSDSTFDQLFVRICQQMEENQLFLNSELKLADLAVALGTNNNYVSTCINSKVGCSFTQFVNRYRVEYVKQRMLQRQGEKLSSIGLESGFANETSFFRAFKTITGMTPGEWLETEKF